MILGPNDRRALRPTGRSWTRPNATGHGPDLSGPVMVDSEGNEYECFSGSVADMSNGRLDGYLNDLTARWIITDEDQGDPLNDSEAAAEEATWD